MDALVHKPRKVRAEASDVCCGVRAQELLFDVLSSVLVKDLACRS